MKGVESKRCEGSGFRCPMFHGGLTSEGAGEVNLQKKAARQRVRGPGEVNLQKKAARQSIRVKKQD